MRAMINADEVSATLGMSRGYAYKLIRKLNKEQEAQGVLTIPGRVSREYFEERMFKRSCKKGEMDHVS